MKLGTADGNNVAFVAIAPDGMPHLYVRSLDSSEARMLADAQVEQAYLGKARAFADDRSELRVVAGVAS